MVTINEILSRYEEGEQNILYGTLVSEKIEWDKKPVFLFLQSIEINQLLFKANNQSLRVILDFEAQGFYDPSFEKGGRFNYFFWLTNFDVKTKEVRINWLPTGPGQIFTESLEVGIIDQIIMGSQIGSLKHISDKFETDFVFQAGGQQLLFIETHPANREQSFTIHGLNYKADIIVQENKWLVTRTTKRNFFNKHEDFLKLNVAIHPTVSFIEASKAKEAYETLRAEEAKGHTLIALWEIYSEIEMNIAKRLQESIGDQSFIRSRFLRDGTTSINLRHLQEDLKTVINENKTELVNTSIEVHLPGNAEGSSRKRPRYRIKEIASDYTITVYDDQALIPEEGMLSISIIGDELVQKRRETAVQYLREKLTIITRNLLFAIEGKAGSMLDKKRNLRALTARTRKFLQEKFDIEKLTDSQQEAVRVAINTPDIAIIQGPPGTGKSTVVAAICDRLTEIAEEEEKKNKKKTNKVILVSAFQNDTVEHIASKVYTLGLPTIKIGKESQIIRAEDEVIANMRLHIGNALQTLSPKSNVFRISKKLKDVQKIYEAEKNEDTLIPIIDKLVTGALDNEKLAQAWDYILESQQLNQAGNDNNIKLLKSLRTEKASYDDDGFEAIQRLLRSDIPFSEAERDLLDNAPLEQPDEQFLEKIFQLKETYLEQLYAATNTISSGTNLYFTDWLKNAITYFTLQEETDSQDEATFLVANLESLLEELDGHSEFVRQAIKDYSESMAATNQVAGSRELNAYGFDNVILEEAARSNPLDLLIPMTRARQRIIMVGDQNQLPHLLEEDIAEETAEHLIEKFDRKETKEKLQRSLFGIIYNNLKGIEPVRIVQLTEQYRMHPFIGRFVSKMYYKGELKTYNELEAWERKKHHLQVPWAKNKAAVFCNVPLSAGLEESGKSKSRTAEAIRIIKLLDELGKDAAFSNLSVGIITFYAKQVNEIYKQALQKGYTVKTKDGNFDIADKYRQTDDGREKLRIGSVDSFQGKEFDIVILSTVRSNKTERLAANEKKVFGFLTLENRLNVAFSRAQRLLIVVGDGDMFADEYACTCVAGLYEFYHVLSIDAAYGNRI